MTDFQKRLLKHIHGADDVLRNTEKLIKACGTWVFPSYYIEQIGIGNASKEASWSYSLGSEIRYLLNYVSTNAT